MEQVQTRLLDRSPEQGAYATMSVTAGSSLGARTVGR